MNDATNNPNQFTDAPGLLETLWPKSCRPSLRWLREQQRAKTIPYMKVGRLVFFDPPAVRDALAKRNTIKAR